MVSENCWVCGKPLFVEKSKKRGVGPVCWSKLPEWPEEDEDHE